MAVVNLILETISDLSTTYLVSPLPNPIKKFLFKTQINKLKKVIDKIPEDRITYETLTEFCKDAFTRYYSYNDKIAKFENMSINIGGYTEKPPFINNSNEFNILINISENSYARIIMQPTNDYTDPRTYRSVFTVRTDDKIMHRPISFSSRSFDKYQEISIDTINRIVNTEGLSQQAIEEYNLVLHMICINLKKYLNSYIGIHDRINI